MFSISWTISWDVFRQGAMPEKSPLPYPTWKNQKKRGRTEKIWKKGKKSENNWKKRKKIEKNWKKGKFEEEKNM